MGAEVRALGPLARHPWVQVGVSGAVPGRARDLARAMVAAGCGRLVSFGLAGGLDPALVPGDLVRPLAVAWDGGRADLVGGVDGLVWGSAAMILTAQDKSALHAATGAVCVDMETQGLVGLGVPVTACRAIADPEGRDLPEYVRHALGPDGRPRLGPILAGLARRPASLRALLALRADSAAGLATLARAARDLGPGWLAP